MPGGNNLAKINTGDGFRYSHGLVPRPCAKMDIKLIESQNIAKRSIIVKETGKKYEVK